MPRILSLLYQQRSVRRKNFYIPAYNPLDHFDEVQFRQSFRMSKMSFLKLFDLVKKVLVRKDRRGSRYIEPHVKLLCALRYFATGSFQVVIGDSYSVSKSTICRLIQVISREIANLARVYIKFPGTRERLEVSCII